MMRYDFLQRKVKSLGYKGVEKRYGCPYMCLFKWTQYEVPLTMAEIMSLRRDSVKGSTEEEIQDLLKQGNAGINKMAKEYEKAIAPRGRSAS